MLESFRKDLSMKHADLRLPIVDFKADWPALVEVCGMRTWSHNLHCCPCCLVGKRDLTVVGHFTLQTCPYPEFDKAAYDARLASDFIDFMAKFQQSIMPLCRICSLRIGPLLCFKLLN